MTEAVRIFPESPQLGDGRLLKAVEVAAMLGVSTPTILAWARRGELPSIRLPGGQIRFREDVVEAWLDELTRGGEAA